MILQQKRSTPRRGGGQPIRTLRCLQWLALVAVGLLPARAQEAGKPAPPAVEDKTSYALGVDLGRNFKRQGIDVDLDQVMRGLKDGYSGEKLAVPEKDFRQLLINAQTRIRQKQAQFRGRTGPEITKKRGELFLAENKDTEGVVVLPSGLQYVVLKPGTGRQPTLTDTVQCSYRATLLDGTEFICTNPGQPAILKVEGADFKGWKEALLLMSAGAHWRCYVPSNLAYGQRGVGREVPPNSTIILDLELVAIQ